MNILYNISCITLKLNLKIWTRYKVINQNFIPKKSNRYAFIFGNEVNGVSQNIIDLCENVIEIPQEGTKHSLNISVSVGVVIWDFYSKFKML